jgi:hypothetical protein
MVKFQDPPPAKTGPHAGGWFQIAAELKARPGEWAIVRENVTSNISTYIRRGGSAAFVPAGSFEATARRNGTPGRVDIYARYVGENGEHA